MNPLRIPATNLGEYDPRRVKISNDEAVERLQEAVGKVSDTLTRHQAIDLEWLTNILESCQVLLSAAQRRALPEVGLVAMANDRLGDAINLLDRCIVGLQQEAAQKSEQEAAQEPAPGARSGGIDMSSKEIDVADLIGVTTSRLEANRVGVDLPRPPG